jgi:hypothetical protein
MLKIAFELLVDDQPPDQALGITVNEAPEVLRLEVALVPSPLNNVQE